MYLKMKSSNTEYKKQSRYSGMKPMLLSETNDIPSGDEWLFDILSRVFLNKYCFISILTLFIYKL